MLKKFEKKEVKVAFNLCKKADQYMNIFKEMIDHHRQKFPSMGDYKSASKITEYQKQLNRNAELL